MKHRAGIVVIAMLAASLLAGTALAIKQGPRGRHDGEGWRGERLEKLLQELKLESDKQAQVEQILQTHVQAADNWHKEHGTELRELHTQAKKARQAGETEKADAAKEKIGELLQSRRQLREDVIQQLGEVLSDEQMSRLKAGFGRWHGRRMHVMAGLRSLDLTEEQQTKAREIHQAARDEAEKADDPKQKREIFEAARKKIHDEVFTDEQRGKAKKLRRYFERCRNMRILGRLDLTDEQKEQVHTIMEAACKKIHDEVLTDEQREKAKEDCEHHDQCDGEHHGRGHGKRHGKGHGKCHGERHGKGPGQCYGGE